MAVTAFAAIDISSYEVSTRSLKCQSGSASQGDQCPLPAGAQVRGTYAAGQLEMGHIDELCEIM